MVLTDCEEVSSLIQKTSLNNESLINVVETYNTCVRSPYVTILSGKPMMKISVGISAGTVQSNLDIFSRIRSGDISYVDVPYEKSKSFQSGITFDISLPRFSDRLSLAGEVVYFNSDFYSYTTTQYALAIDKNYVTIGMEQLSIPIGVRYTLFSNRISPYSNLVFLNTINLKIQNRLDREVILSRDNSTVFDEGLALKKINNQYGFWLGGGILLPRTKWLTGFVELRSESSYGLSDMPDVSNINNIRISFGLKIQ